MKKSNQNAPVTSLPLIQKMIYSYDYDLYREPYREYCPECEDWVIALDGHCINNDAHLTSTFTPEERKTLFIKRSWEDGPESIA